ncbi:hypothetical protein, partial [Staphylococcus epidermidis]|uniref:hypothetical protein n=1 Tax=Staphylococcus epidermidis TaxID=1282 RepID=UPI0021B332DC
LPPNDHTFLTQTHQPTFITPQPPILYFHSQYSFNLICIFTQHPIYYYSNLSSPFPSHQEPLKYIHYHLHIKLYPNPKYHLLDEHHYHQHINQINYPHHIHIILTRNLHVLQQSIEQKNPPFPPHFINLSKQPYKKITHY